MSIFSSAPVKVTIPEGYTVKDIARKLRPFKNFDQENFLAVASKYEGRLFPDTYFLGGMENENDVLRMMLNNFYKKVGKTDEKILIMASILEKEAKKKEDMEIISGILWKRLSNDIPLQVDSTLSYYNGKTSEQMTKEDLSFDSPYNTYIYKGLPPTPICNPGLRAINAAKNPKDSPYWYYLSDNDGNIHYAKTLEEHNANKKRYLK